MLEYLIKGVQLHRGLIISCCLVCGLCCANLLGVAARPFRCRLIGEEFPLAVVAEHVTCETCHYYNQEDKQYDCREYSNLNGHQMRMFVLVRIN